ncbi:MAG TPA: enoyl-CoA hydratase/isomerase family protein [Candidatus Paenalcaligenes intestinipullorum]|uniref:Enoyl-CoA hydratase/isomerase family protein n=1 Tax=Candidatus Paenalcaligenes intestinipullorum TaxID=2838718 RepID=A0A9D2U8I4_9BURK|nr:enoyl-CoA hydratase/isomerase family protein [Candidatus Paenalcaligenes intestinipullorum]
MSENFANLGLRNWTCSVDAQGIAWLSLDVVNSSVNRLSAPVLQELDRALDFFYAAPPVALIIRSAKHNGFIAGADIDEFSSLDSPDKSESMVLRGWSVMERVAKLHCPTLALIHGHCLGGGLELALACRYRLLIEDSQPVLALPEVKLGIFPGWGGMMRLPQLIGAPKALDMMLTGRNIRAKQAKALGLVDALVPQRIAELAAAKHVLSHAKPRQARGLDAWLNRAPLKRLAEKQALKQVAKSDPYHHYPAPRAIVDIWANHGGNPLHAADTIHEITSSSTVHNLVRVFHLQERLKAFGKRTTKPPLQHVHVIGAGTMGGDIAALCASKGIRVTLQDQRREPIAKAQARAQRLFERRLREPRLVRQAMDRFIPDLQGHGITQADLVIEAIVENLEAKQALYAQIEPLLKPGAVLATNTSSLALSALSAKLLHPNRLVGIHFFNPVAVMPLIEVVHTPELDADVRDTAMAFCDQIGKLPLPVRDTPGFLVNAVLAPYMLEAMRCVDEGIQPETIDEAMLQFGMPMGPIELIDTVGLDIARDVGVQLTDADAMPACLAKHLEKQQLGRKTGQGFYTWKDGKADKQRPQTVPHHLALRLIAPLINRTQEQVHIGVVSDADLADAGVIFGTGFAPFTGGPLHYKDHMHQPLPNLEASPTV